MLSNHQKKHILTNKEGIEYYTVQGLEDIHKEMLRLLFIIDTIAKENNIDYWIDGGSLIGIIRHKGFIPWDDDLDISMLKKDYLKLINKLSKYCTKHNDVALFYDEPLIEHTCNFFASKRLFSRTQGSCILVPVKIDIRPVNCIIKNEELLKQNMNYRDTANYIIFGKSYGHMTEVLKERKQQEDFLKHYNYEYGLCDTKADNVIMVHPYYEFSNTFELTHKDLFPTKRLPFENILLPVPQNYDYLLKKLYGDYMNLPDIHHRAPVACEVYSMEMTNSQFKECLSFFKRSQDNFRIRIRTILKQIKLLGIVKYIKIKLYE